MSEHKYNADAVEQDDRFFTVVVTFDDTDPAVYDAGMSMAEAVHVRVAVRDELEAEGHCDHITSMTIVGVQKRRLARRAMSAVRHGWDDDIETLEEFADRPHKGVLHDGTPYTQRLASEDFKADEEAKARPAHNA